MTNTNTNTTNETTTKVVPNHISKLTTKSAVIRALHKEGWTKSEIVKYSNLTYKNGDRIRYQHVYNVLNQKVKS